MTPDEISATVLRLESDLLTVSRLLADAGRHAAALHVMGFARHIVAAVDQLRGLEGGDDLAPGRSQAAEFQSNCFPPD